MTGARPPGEAVGSLVGEASQLLDALAAKLSELPRPQPAAAGPSCLECGHDPAAPCTGCPLCALLAIVRGQRPEATAKLLDAAGAVITALRGLLDRSNPDPAQPPGQTPSGSAPGVERIDIK